MNTNTSTQTSNVAADERMKDVVKSALQEAIVSGTSAPVKAAKGFSVMICRMPRKPVAPPAESDAS